MPVPPFLALVAHCSVRFNSTRFERADGAPKLGWHDTIAYLTIPLILVITQSISTKIMQPKQDPSKPMDESQAASQNASIWP